MVQNPLETRRTLLPRRSASTFTHLPLLTSSPPPLLIHPHPLIPTSLHSPHPPPGIRCVISCSPRRNLSPLRSFWSDGSFLVGPGCAEFFFFFFFFAPLPLQFFLLRSAVASKFRRLSLRCDCFGDRQTGNFSFTLYLIGAVPWGIRAFPLSTSCRSVLPRFVSRRRRTEALGYPWKRCRIEHSLRIMTTI